MVTIELTDEEFDTMYEANISYIEYCTKQMEAMRGNHNKQNYWHNEYTLAKELFKKVVEVEERNE